MRRKVDGFFTVEAAMVLSITLSAILLIIYLLFFQYNRCLMEQDMGTVALRGAVMQEEDMQDRLYKLKSQTGSLYQEKYVAWEYGEIGYKLEKGKIYVESTGKMQFPFSKMFGDVDYVWSTTSIFENHILSPVSWIRNYRKITRVR